MLDQLLITLLANIIIRSNHGFLYYTRTDFMPLADSQKKAKFIQYTCIQFTAHWAQYIYDNFLLDIYNTLK